MSDFMSRWLRHSSEPQKNIKRWLNQRCIGYQYLWKGEERLEICVIEGQVELEDGRIVMAWQRRIWPHYAGNYPGHEFAIEFERPRINIRPNECGPERNVGEMTTTEFKRKMQADGWNVRKLKKLEVFEISADGVPTFRVTFAELYPLTDCGLLIAEKLRPAIHSIFGG